MSIRDWTPMRFDVEFWGGAMLGLTIGVVVMLMVLR
jgi:hypothetical protein